MHSQVGHIWTVAATAGCCVWVGYSKGTVDMYTSLGRLIKSVRLYAN